jgi:CRISPR/Cas system CSM-associated protein Csm2 small subunit
MYIVPYFILTNILKNHAKKNTFLSIFSNNLIFIDIKEIIINKKYNMKRRIKLSESDLHRVIKESVNKVLKEDFDMDEFSKQKQDYDVMMNTYECNLSFLEVQSIKSYMTRIKTLVNKIRKGENSEIVYKYLYNCIDNINNIMENK